MKKGFTMIELIFVIVILGILAAVAIPRLAATRDDAEIAKAATNISTLVSEITSAYAAQGVLPAALENITNIPVDGTGQTVNLQVKGANCVTFTVGNAQAADATRSIAVGDPILTITPAATNTEAACVGARAAAQRIINSSPIKLGGSSINFTNN